MFIIDLSYCSSADAEQVIEVEEQCFSSPWPRAVIKSDLRGNYPCFYLGAWGTSKLLGFAVLARKKEKALLSNIAVLSQYRRRGIATQLLLGISETALSLKFTRILLSVRVSNDGAVVFYKKTGFRLIGRERDYYEDGEDALELEAPLPLSFSQK